LLALGVGWWHSTGMNHSDLTQGEQLAMRRVSAGSEVGTDMWQDLFRKHLVERRLGKQVLTEKGRTALALTR
jgi:hypothetical protein